MNADIWTSLGWVIVLSLPLTVLFAVIFWPERIPKDRTVQAIRQRIESDDDPPLTPKPDTGRNY